MKRSIKTRRGFTLIELLVTMLIMSIMGVAMAMVMSGAEDSARIAKTRSLIARLHTLVMQKYEGYRTRRLPVVMPPGLSPRQAAQVRCDVIRQLMRLEMPERWTDIIDGPAPIPAGNTVVQMVRPSCSQSYKAFYDSVKNGPNFGTAKQQGAKCLYLLITMGLDDADVMENFSEGDIADVDKTGCKVFLDAWGNPIHFLRWAPNFVSYLQPAKPGTNGTSATARDLRMPDQTDPTGIYGAPKNSTTPANSKQDTFALYPLIYSDGPDGDDALVTELPGQSANFRYATTSPPNDPFASMTDPSFTNGPIGSVLSGSSAASDNIHNHLIGAR